MGSSTSKTGLLNSLESSINPATEEKQDNSIAATQDALDQYKISNIDADASPNYYGFEDKDGSWYILKETISAGADVYTYCKGTSAYATAWTNRASQTYQSYSATF